MPGLPQSMWPTMNNRIYMLLRTRSHTTTSSGSFCSGDPFQALHDCRLEEINRKRELDVKLQAKRHEILVAQKLERESKLGIWLRTAAQPSLLWLPKFHNEDTQLLLEQRQADLEVWKVRIMCRCCSPCHGRSTVHMRP